MCEMSQHTRGAFVKEITRRRRRHIAKLLLAASVATTVVTAGALWGASMVGVFDFDAPDGVLLVIGGLALIIGLAAGTATASFLDRRGYTIPAL